MLLEKHHLVFLFWPGISSNGLPFERVFYVPLEVQVRHVPICERKREGENQGKKANAVERWVEKANLSLAMLIFSFSAANWRYILLNF